MPLNFCNFTQAQSRPALIALQLPRCAVRAAAAAEFNLRAAAGCGYQF
jgi:hypothetical protein